MTEVLERPDRAVEQWEVLINPFPIFGDVLFMIYFKQKEQSFKHFYRYYKTLPDAQQEQRRLHRDLTEMRTDKFQEKYRIGYDLKGGIL